jgi:hypothetical protein
MTPKQARLVEFLKGHHLKTKSYGDVNNYESKKYEVKEEIIGTYKPTPYVIILSEIGRKNDEHTYAAIFCRDRRHLMIGPNGGIRLLNEKNYKKVEGLFNAFNCLTY